MAPKSNRQVVEQYVQALIARDLDLQAEVCAPDVIVDYPQSGERIRGWANVRGAHENYPGGLPQEVDGKVIGFWPDLEPVVALNSLNQTVYFLRRVFEPEFSEEVSPGYLHHDSNVLWLDTGLVSARSALCWDLARAATAA